MNRTVPCLTALLMLLAAVFLGCADPQRVEQLEDRINELEKEAGELGDQASESAKKIGAEAKQLGREAAELGEAAAKRAAEAGRGAGRAARRAALGEPTLVINLTSGVDNPHSAAMGLHLAEHGLNADRRVIIFFNVKAVELARKDLSEDVALEQTGPLRDLIAKVTGEGAQGLVCPMCAEVMGVAQEDLAPNIKMVEDRMDLFSNLHANSVVFTY